MPSVSVYLDRIEQNARKLLSLCGEHGIKLGFVTKVYASDERIIERLDKLDFAFFADSRIENLVKIQSQKPKMLLRLPAFSQAKEIVECADISLNSEIKTIEELDKQARILGKVHKIVLMIDIGDLREGIYYKDIDKICDVVKYIDKASNLELLGLGTNLTCYGSVIPTVETMQKLVKVKDCVEKECKVSIKMMSGGNSSGIPLIMNNEMPKEINSMRLGECLALGTEAAYGNVIDGCRNDAFLLSAEIIEVQKKPSMPEGELGYNAFHQKVQYIDKGYMIRAICAVGEQDIDASGLICVNDGVEILGASSDHLILDITKAEGLEVGDSLEFKLNYSALLRAFTSKYVNKRFIG